MRRRAGRPGLLGTVARTAVVAGTATAVSGGMQRRSAEKQAQQQQQSAPPAPAPTPTPAAAPMNRIAKLKELGDLKTSGVLTQAEFESEKARILAS